jgi:hypothetical protein
LCKLIYETFKNKENRVIHREVLVKPAVNREGTAGLNKEVKSTQKQEGSHQGHALCISGKTSPGLNTEDDANMHVCTCYKKISNICRGFGPMKEIHVNAVWDKCNRS